MNHDLSPQLLQVHFIYSLMDHLTILAYCSWEYTAYVWYENYILFTFVSILLHTSEHYNLAYQIQQFSRCVAPSKKHSTFFFSLMNIE